MAVFPLRLRKVGFAKQEYCGDTVNFRSTTKSFKNKTKIERPQEEWKIFPNTHPAIIDR
ncbi:MAG: recombinase family protein, partial [Bacteroidales bacterium]|nr:recombinase family protein [Bacteroidales bacterium]